MRPLTRNRRTVPCTDPLWQVLKASAGLAFASTYSLFSYLAFEGVSLSQGRQDVGYLARASINLRFGHPEIAAMLGLCVGFALASFQRHGIRSLLADRKLAPEIAAAMCSSSSSSVQARDPLSAMDFSLWNVGTFAFLFLVSLVCGVSVVIAWSTSLIPRVILYPEHARILRLVRGHLSGSEGRDAQEAERRIRLNRGFALCSIAATYGMWLFAMFFLISG